MPWKLLTDVAQLDEIAAASAVRPQILFKHSTRCSISSMVLSRMEQQQPALEAAADVWLLDLLAYRPVSDAVATRFHVFHESPQAILIVNGEAVLDQSHMSVRPAELLEQVQQSALAGN